MTDSTNYKPNFRWLLNKMSVIHIKFYWLKQNIRFSYELRYHAYVKFFNAMLHKIYNYSRQHAINQ